MNKPETKFHPNMFETTNGHLPQEDRTLASIKDQRSAKTTDMSSHLQATGSFKLTVDDNSLSKSNTQHLFKNLYGETLLTRLFFSASNVNNLQKVIRFIIHRETGESIDNQSNNELLIIMRSLFLEYSAHPALVDEKMSKEEKTKLYNKYTEEVKRLNEIVINTVVPKVMSQMQQYLDYLRDASQQPYQMNSPTNTNIAGERQYRSVTQLLLGTDL
jgi:hypothetical protein